MRLNRIRADQLRDLTSKATFIQLSLRLIWTAASRWTSAWAALLVVQGLLPAAVVYLTKTLVDSIAAAVGAGVSWEGAMTVLIPAGLMAAVLLLQRVLGGFTEWITTAQAELVGDHVKMLVHEKATAVDYGFYESSHYHDQLEQVNSQATSRILQLLQNFGALARSAITFVSIAVILMQYSVFLPLVLVVSTLPAFLVILRHNRLYHTWWEGSTARRRMAVYFDQMITLDAAAAEVRINGLGDYFRSRYQSLRETLRNERLALLRRQVVAKFGAGLIALVITAGTIGWIGLRALRGEATLGDLALFYQAFNQGQSLMGTLLQSMGQIYTNTLFLEHLFHFLDQKNEIEDRSDPAVFPEVFSDGVRFEDVTFTYPGSEKPALENFNLHIPAGKIVGIVGENGAGKSTFIKLLCRFYDPDSGRILINGQDIRLFAQADLRRHISVMFQFPMKYQATARENIALGDIGDAYMAEELEAAARAGGAHEVITSLPRGYDTVLGRWFATGTELSGGEWQRVALARAFLRRAPLVILDEPTSFMDSWAENDWLRRFRRVVEGRTALVITHRFTTAMQADVIHVMDSGNIVESGTHAELVHQGGHYAASWAAQMLQADHQMERPEME